MGSTSGVVASSAPTCLEIAVCPDDVAAWAATVPPGPAVAGPLGALDPARLSQPGRIDAIVALERLAAWTAAQQARMIAALAGPPAPGGDPDLVPDPPQDKLSSEQRLARLNKEWIKEDLRAALGESALGAGDRIRTARELTGRLQPTLTALAAGRIGARHARYLLEALLVHDDVTAAAVQHAVLPDPADAPAPAPPLPRFRRDVRREILDADPGAAARRQVDAVAQRRVSVLDQADGTSSLFAILPTEGAALITAALRRATARRDPDDSRTLDQCRADALVQLARDALTGRCPHHPGDESRGAAGPAVQVTVALSTLLGLDHQAGELNGQPIPAALARHLAGDENATWRRLVTDETGRLVDYGRSTYRPPADLARQVTARDRTCTFPTCTRAAETCELDHIVDWAHGGQTNHGNLATLCPRHHHAKHDAGWRYRREPDGDLRWRSPTGRTYRTPAAIYPRDRTGDTAREHAITPSDPDPPF